MRANNQTSCQCPGPAYTISASLHNASSLPWSGAHSLGFYAQCLVTALVRSSHSRLLFAKDHQRQHVVSTAVNLQCDETQPDVAKRETTPKAGLACSAFLSHSESLIAIWALVVWTDFCHVGKQFSFSPWVPNYSLFLFDGDILFLRCPMCHRGENLSLFHLSILVLAEVTTQYSAHWEGTIGRPSLVLSLTSGAWVVYMIAFIWNVFGLVQQPRTQSISMKVLWVPWVYFLLKLNQLSVQELNKRSRFI